MDRVAGEVATASTRWGIHIEFVKIQRVRTTASASSLTLGGEGHGGHGGTAATEWV